MSESGSESGEREGEREVDREPLRDLMEDDEERGERDRRRDHNRETEEEGAATTSSSSTKATSSSDVARTECCSACLSKNRNNGRSCICQVPARQRRAPLGVEGCITCKCTGCHPEDILNAQGLGDGEKPNGERRSHRDKERHSSTDREMRYDDSSTKDRDREKDQRVREKEARRDRASSPSADGEVPLKNGCCRPCMKAFSEHKRACLCQVPVDVRMGHLPEAGCKICGCHGCHPEEKSVRRSAYPPPHINPYTRAPMASGGDKRRYLHPPPLAPFYPPMLPLGGRRDPRDSRDVRDYHHSRDVRDPRDLRNGRDVRDRDVRDRDNFRGHREPHLDDRRGGLLPFPPPFPYPLPRPDYDPYRGRVDPRFDNRDGLYREREAREREVREREARERYMSHRDDRIDTRERPSFERPRHGEQHEADRDRERDRAREHERERERRDRDRGEHDYNRKRDRTRETEHYNDNRDSKRSRELL